MRLHEVTIYYEPACFFNCGGGPVVGWLIFSYVYLPISTYDILENVQDDRVRRCTHKCTYRCHRKGNGFTLRLSEQRAKFVQRAWHQKPGDTL